MPFVAGQKPTAQELNDELGMSTFAGEKVRASTLNAATGAAFPVDFKLRAAEFNEWLQEEQPVGVVV